MQTKYFATALILLALIGTASAATSVSQFGITWAFDQDYETGQFANGDYWVVGPVTIVGIDPPSVSGSRVMNGSMINPVGGSHQHGFDSAASYDSSLNVALDVDSGNPLEVLANSSLVSTISLATPINSFGVVHPVDTAAVLTVLDSAPAEGSFRPTYVGTDKAIKFNKSQLDYSLLQKLEPVASTPNLSEVERYVERPWIEFKPGYSGGATHPYSNMGFYGREISRNAGTISLMLHLDFTNQEKETLLVRFVQLGIDYYGNVEQGNKLQWVSDGAHGSGRKWPILFAGLMLNDEDMKGIGSISGDYGYNPDGTPKNPVPEDYFYFGEDGQTFYITTALATSDYPNDESGQFGRPIPGYSYPWITDFTASDIGNPEWGMKGLKDHHRDDRDWVSAYRGNTCSAAWPGFVLAAQMTPNGKELWNNNALFDYEDRFIEVQQSRPGIELYQIAWSRFVLNMWNAYRADYGCIWTRDDQTACSDVDDYDGSCYSNGHIDCSQCVYNCDGGPECGDGECNAIESCGSCPVDCGVCPVVCGDGSCDSEESCSSCPSDCGACPAVCGNGACESTESCAVCSADCGECDYDIFIDFEAGNDGSWTSYNPGGGTPNWSVVNDSFNGGTNAYQLGGIVDRISEQTSLGAYSIINDAQAENFVLEGSLRSTESFDWRDLGIIFGHQNENQHYVVIFNGGCDPNTNGIFRVVSGAKEKIGTVCSCEGAGCGVLNDQQYNGFKIVRQSPSIEVYFDDMATPVFTASDNTFGLGQFGVGSINDTGLFDNIAITSLEEECVSMPALLNYISQWKQGSIEMTTLLEKIALWKAGC